MKDIKRLTDCKSVFFACFLFVCNNLFDSETLKWNPYQKGTLYKLTEAAVSPKLFFSYFLLKMTCIKRNCLYWMKTCYNPVGNRLHHTLSYCRHKLSLRNQPTFCNPTREVASFSTTGLSLRGAGQGFSPATMNVALGYFHKKIEEK